MSLPPPLPPPDGFICQGLFYEVGDVDEHCTQPHHNKWAEDQMREYGELCRKMALEEAAKEVDHIMFFNGKTFGEKIRELK